jgi:predicted DNA-binding protein
MERLSTARGKQLLVTLSDEEYEDLVFLTKNTNQTKQQYLRSMITGYARIKREKSLSS